jgi:hypothetical protein
MGNARLLDCKIARLRDWRLPASTPAHPGIWRDRSHASRHTVYPPVRGTRACRAFNHSSQGRTPAEQRQPVYSPDLPPHRLDRLRTSWPRQQACAHRWPALAPGPIVQEPTIRRCGCGVDQGQVPETLGLDRRRTARARFQRLRCTKCQVSFRRGSNGRARRRRHCFGCPPRRLWCHTRAAGCDQNHSGATYGVRHPRHHFQQTKKSRQKSSQAEAAFSWSRN